jgi:diguanylate cyclase
MGYSHTKEESTELLRRTLQLMTPLPAGYLPPNYAVCYEHVAGINPRLSRNLEVLLSQGECTNAALLRLYVSDIAGRDVEAFEAAQRDLQILLDKAEEAASVTGAGLTGVEGTLDSSLDQLRKPISVEGLGHLVVSIRAELTRARNLVSQFAEILTTGKSDLD